MKFEWDPDKEQANIAKHGISFDEAAEALSGFTIERVDDRFDYGEVRDITLGMTNNLVVVVVVHTDRAGVCRIISARHANRAERKVYDKAFRSATHH